MYIQKVEIRQSCIHGKGVFSLTLIPKDSVVWRFDPTHDRSYTAADYQSLSTAERKELDHSAYLSPWSGLWICPPTNDPACFTNHSSKNNISAVFDASVSSEPYFVANRNIKCGEEITNNYNEFDQLTQLARPEWAK